VNIHPALLPGFGGKGMYGSIVHQSVLEAGCKITGVTVHLVDEEYDRGPIVAQRAVVVAEDDNAETLAARVLKVEHRLYPEVLTLFAQDRVQIQGRQVKIVKR
jgi:phosphoribosylglycinamide formyltransferase-1